MKNKTIFYLTSISTSFLILFWLILIPSVSFSKSTQQPKTPKNTSLLFEGSLLIFSPQDLFIQQLENTEPLKLSFQDLNAELLLHRLNHGDFISIQAQKLSPTELRVSGINYIGLVSLLGTWLGDDNVCYHFKSFTTFYIFNPDALGTCIFSKNITLTKSLRKMSYFITPDDMGWFMLISDKSTQYAAELIIKNSKTIQINLFAEQTGDILSKAILRR